MDGLRRESIRASTPAIGQRSRRAPFGYDACVLDSDPDGALPVLQGILERYVESPDPAEQRIAVAVKSMIAELKQKREEAGAVGTARLPADTRHRPPFRD